ncbi:hypothetical protein QN386_20900 [Pseudomonas sp. CCI3.2]|uniref:hypothetical protein n=1 Tax=unclassified Pseudomonas TaxID=196821 RepID=UPI002AC8CADC|nr:MULTISPECIES: hypothetical protein [unclassified Pseudomonas]MEB0079410.1 hypothetical protein [Pseudomonas sp. MH10out]MEB0103764.1 hypothetical protein [Pseudomonas sp. CCI3.2]MEB0132391.1 hypothetical protein [Pseudomonas sp. CCI2.4]MEB0160841.1 hypothetical protein [Pseudomonas sp. AH2 (2023)]MEB0169119.1 hypothetical protein [Pseudomonas sp. CCC4.4]
MTQEEKDLLFALLLTEYQGLFAGMDELNRTLWFAVNEENELMSFVVGPSETLDLAVERYKVKLLAMAAALESLPCAAIEQLNISDLRYMAAHTTTRPAEEVIPEGKDYLSDLNRMTPEEFSQHIADMYKHTLEQLRSEGRI